MDEQNTPATKGDLQAALQAALEKIFERIYDTETRLLSAFADYAKASDIRFRKLEADTGNLSLAESTRLADMERRMHELTLRVLHLEARQ